ncbi:hypothetical protein M8C21_021229, partial [Ambrosia artemisiifolia]
EPGKIHLVLEYCKGGDLSMFIQRRQGRISKSTSAHFMQQLAAGLKVLRDNQIIHRDLKPQLNYCRIPKVASHIYFNFSIYVYFVYILSVEQNLLLSTNDDNSTLKIADFGFAR